MLSTITSHEILVLDLFSAKYCYNIPTYQRHYSWLRENAEQLFDDVKDSALSSALSVKDLKPYFMGSMVLIKKNQEPTSEVIDGQQRLTTLTILLSAIREISKTRNIKVNEEDFSSSVDPFIYEKGNVAAGIAASFRLHVRPSDSDFFQKHIQLPDGFKNLNPDLPLSDGQKRITVNALILMERLKTLNDEEIIKLGQYILQKIHLAIVTTSDEEAAFRIFNVLNDRGLDLSTADILKAEIIGALPNDKQDVYSQKWEECEEALGNEKFSELFGYIRTIGVRKKAKESIVKEIRDFLKPKSNPISFIDDQLVPYAQILEEFTEGSLEVTSQKDEINEAVKWLNQLSSVNYVGNTEWIPTSLVLVDKLRGTPKVLLEALLLLETLTLGLMVMHKSPTERIERFSKVLNELMKGGYPSCQSIKLSAGEKTEVMKKLEDDIYSEYYCKYVLKRLDKYTAGVGANYEDPKTVTIEHILPQNPNPGSKWIKDFPRLPGRSKTTNKIGNLTLLTGKRNTAAGNRDYLDKIKTYFVKRQGHFVLTAKLATEYLSWTPTDFDRRQKEMLAACKVIWDL